MSPRRRVPLALALVFAAALLVPARVLPARTAHAAGAPALAIYSLTGSVTVTPVPTGVINPCDPTADIPLCPGVGSATGACVVCAAGQPTDAVLGLVVAQVTDAPPGSCHAVGASGQLSAFWPTATVNANIQGHFLADGATLALTGEFPPTPTFGGSTFLLLVNGYPPNPCVSATSPITATLSIFPPAPI